MEKLTLKELGKKKRKYKTKTIIEDFSLSDAVKNEKL